MAAEGHLGPWEESGWLRDRVAPHLRVLYEEPGKYHARLIADFIDRAGSDPGLENDLIDAIEMAIEEGDDVSGGTAWVALILGEVGSRAAVPVLIRTLEEAEDETLHEAAVDALARIGSRAVEAVSSALEEDPSRAGARGLIRALEQTAAASRELDRVRDLLLDLLGHQADLEASVVEELSLSLAHLGERRAVQLIRRVCEDRFRGGNSVLQDAAEMLEENRGGVPLVSGPTPWRDRFAWVTGRFPTPGDEDRPDLDRLWRGMIRPGEDLEEEEGEP